eukprot:TRINITY_DN9670_c0_g1_i1.p1 TRINITY_DN9670_c0_g1~~TRINITY_DN9670_c0_g1_i1.p1  ORF type:complete len:1171 (-),score=117.30 TRINITY_DN9670_c0_g1_i1:13-3525(-)
MANLLIAVVVLAAIVVILIIVILSLFTIRRTPQPQATAADTLLACPAQSTQSFHCIHGPPADNVHPALPPAGSGRSTIAIPSGLQRTHSGTELLTLGGPADSFTMDMTACAEEQTLLAAKRPASWAGSRAAAQHKAVTLSEKALKKSPSLPQTKFARRTSAVSEVSEQDVTSVDIATLSSLRERSHVSLPPLVVPKRPRGSSGGAPAETPFSSTVGNRRDSIALLVPASSASTPSYTSPTSIALSAFSNPLSLVSHHPSTSTRATSLSSNVAELTNSGNQRNTLPAAVQVSVVAPSPRVPETPWAPPAMRNFLDVPGSSASEARLLPVEELLSLPSPGVSQNKLPGMVWGANSVPPTPTPATAMLQPQAFSWLANPDSAGKFWQPAEPCQPESPANQEPVPAGITIEPPSQRESLNSTDTSLVLQLDNLKKRLSQLEKENTDLRRRSERMSYDAGIGSRAPSALLDESGSVLSSGASAHSLFGHQRRRNSRQHRLAVVLEPPTGKIALIFTDVQSSTYLWNMATGAMRQAIRVHNEIFRNLLRSNKGYEVKTEGDSFMIATNTVLDAVRFCVAAQLQLLEADWPAALLALPEAKEVAIPAGVGWLWRGLRVRMGVHSGEPFHEMDPTTARMDYFGPVVNRAARIAAHGRGGEIVLSQAAFDDIQPVIQADPTAGSEISGGIALSFMGEFAIKGFAPSRENNIYQVLPQRLRARTFADDSDPQTPITVRSVQSKKLIVDNVSGIAPPSGSMALVITAVPACNETWHISGQAMQVAYMQHNTLLRALSRRHHGYEVKTEGDAFLLAFSNPADALLFCCNVQLELLQVDWPAALLQLEDFKPVVGTCHPLAFAYRGLRVRMGVHYGTPEADVDPNTGHVEYYGSAVGHCSRISQCAVGGDVLVSSSLYNSLKGTELESMHDQFVFTQLRPVVLGEQLEVLYRVLPTSLAAVRRIPTEALSPNTASEDDKFDPAEVARPPTRLSTMNECFGGEERICALLGRLSRRQTALQTFESQLMAMHDKDAGTQYRSNPGSPGPLMPRNESLDLPKSLTDLLGEAEAEMRRAEMGASTRDPSPTEASRKVRYLTTTRGFDGEERASPPGTPAAVSQTDDGTPQPEKDRKEKKTSFHGRAKRGKMASGERWSWRKARSEGEYASLEEAPRMDISEGESEDG